VLAGNEQGFDTERIEERAEVNLRKTELTVESQELKARTNGKHVIAETQRAPRKP
jgi:hypothetical protein